MKVEIQWRHDKDLGYYSWCAVNIETHEVVAKGFKRCEQILAWCDNRSITIESIDTHGTRV